VAKLDPRLLNTEAPVANACRQMRLVASSEVLMLLLDGVDAT
jgi:hypothetical protein